MLHSSSVPITRASVDASRRIVNCIASSETEDSWGRVVKQDWDLTRYKANPVVLMNHDAQSLPIGRSENVRVEKGKLLATIVFADALANPAADYVWNSIQQGSLRAISVGWKPGSVAETTVDGRDVVVMSKNVLMEISLVNLPANPDALMVASMAGVRQRIAYASPEWKQLSPDDKARFLLTSPALMSAFHAELDARKASEEAAHRAKYERTRSA